MSSDLSSQQARAGYFFVMPAFVLYTTFVLAPAAVTIVLSFSYYDFLKGATWTGFENYLKILSDRRFGKIFTNTFVFTFFAVILNNAIALILALALNRVMPGWLLYFFRLAFFLPVIIAGSFVSIVWSFFLSNELGVVNYYLKVLGLPAVNWLTSDVAMTSIILVDVWKNTGFFMIIFIAALQGVPKPIMEAATLDAASPWRRFWNITFPYISPVIFFNVVLASIGALQVYESIFILTEGGPGDNTRSMTMYITEKAFTSFDFGYAAAISVVLMLVILMFTLMQFAVSKYWVR